jgi:hypothetical protein
MTNLRKKAMIGCVLAAVPVVSQAQSVAPGTPAQTFTPTAATQSTPDSQAQQAVLVGLPAVDIITLNAIGPATPLRYGNVVPGSETVQLDGTPLRLATDYAIDNAAGVIYLLRSQKAGQALTVSYRYDSKAAPVTPGSSLMGVSGMHYSLSPSLSMSMGLGIAERAADGSVLTTNSMGWSNNLSMGSGKMSGLFVVGQRNKESNFSGLQMDTAGKPGDASNKEGSSEFIVQQFRTSLLGGQAGVDYQDVSRNFSSFSEVRAAGYSDGAVKSLTAERGLTRTGFSLDGVKFGAMQLSSSFKDVKDGQNALQWTTLGLTQGGLKLNWNSRDLNHKFTRFADLSDTDRTQLQNESGMRRSDFSGSFSQKLSQFSFDTKSIRDDATGEGISKRDFKFDQGTTKLDFGDQQISNNFSRFGNLLADEKGSYGREAGLSRQWLALDSAVFGKTNTLSFHEMELGGQQGQFRSDAFAYTSKTWSLQHIDMSAGNSMSSLNALQDSEQDSNIKLIASMYGTGIATGPADRGQFNQGTGIARTYTAFAAQPYQNWKVNFTDLNLSGVHGGIETQTGSVSGKNLQLTYRHSDYATQFTQASTLLGLEQQRVGGLAGLDRTDLGFSFTLSPTRKLTASRLTANAPDGGANRTTAEYVDKRIDVQYSARDVSTGFQTNGQVIDSEAGLFTALRGFSEQDARVKWQLAANMKLDTQYSAANNLATGTKGEYDNSVFDWAPNKNTQLQYARQDGRNSDPLNTVVDSIMQKFSVTESIGKYGKVQLIDQEAKYGIPGSTLPDYHTQYVSYETKLTTNTSFKTEQSRTDYGNGGSENIDSNTVSTTITKHAGVSVTNTQITAHGETQQDETKRNYGFWYDIGNGLRISYGYARDLNGPNGGTLNSTFAVGKNADTTTNAQLGAVQPGQVGNVSVGGGYGVNQWDAPAGQDRVQSFSNVGINTLKPMKFGFIKDITLKCSMDTAADYSAWIRENRLISASGKIGAQAIGVEYKSQMNVTGDRAIDRGFHWASDQNPKGWLRATIGYKERTLPGNQTIAIRDYSVTAKATKKIEITTQLQTNPEVVRTDLILGTLPQASRSNKWKIDYLTDVRTTIGSSWEEMRNDSNGAISRTGGLNAKLFANSPSPVTVFYGLQQTDAYGTARKTMQRYSLQFDQKAGPRQALNVFLGNISYDNTIDPGKLKNNWTVRVNYQLKF